MRRVATIMITAALAALTAGAADALTRFPEGGTGVTPAVKALLAKAAPGEKTVRIGDMVFRTETLAKSGYTGDPWPEGLVFYEFDESVTSYQRDQWRTAAAVWSDVADLTFIEGEGPAPYYAVIHVSEQDGNWSEVGIQIFGQEMSIVSWDSLYRIAHEICHALGFVHEQSRPDRDQYVQINWDNIDEDKWHDFEIRDADMLTGYYDFDSVMHYGPCDFVWDYLTCPPDYSITVLPPNDVYWQTQIGQREHLSAGDIIGMGIVYGASCHGPIYVDSNALWVPNGSLRYPFISLAAAVDFACPGAEIRILEGIHPYSPITIGKQMLITAPAGAAVIQ